MRTTYKMKVQEQRQKDQQAIDEYNEWVRRKVGKMNLFV